jgi:hypothetical protein
LTDNAQLCISHGDGWTHLGETDGPIRLETTPGLAGEFETVRFPGPVSVTITVDATGALASIYRMLHDIDLAHRPRKHGHCPTCHPEMDVRPLAVNGHDYHRRRKARQRRKHR